LRFSMPSRPALRPTQPSVQRVSGVFGAYSVRGMVMTIRRLLMPRCEGLELYFRLPSVSAQACHEVALTSL